MRTRKPSACATCAYFVVIDSDDPNVDDHWGECHRRAPQINDAALRRIATIEGVSGEPETPFGHLQLATLWPATSGCMGCGDHAYATPVDASALAIEIEAHDAQGSAMRADEDNADWNRHVDQGYGIYRRVFDLPNTPANLPVRARAIASMVNDDGDVENLNLSELAAHGESLCGEMIRQVLVCITSKEGR